MSKKKSTHPDEEFVGDARIKEAHRRLLADEAFEGLDVSGAKRTIAPHPIACEVPPMSYEEFTRLGMRVEQFGFREPVILTTDHQQVIEGRNRVAVAWCLGIPLRKITVLTPAGKAETTLPDGRFALGYRPLDWADSDLRELSTDKNDIRRHYTPALTALLAWNRYGPEAKAGAKERMEGGVAPTGARGHEKASEEVARLSGLGARSIERISIVSATDTPRTYEKVWTREIVSVLAAHTAAKAEIAEAEKRARAAAATKPEKTARAPRSSSVGTSLAKAFELLSADMEKLRGGVRPVMSPDEQRERLIEIQGLISEWNDLLDRDDDPTPAAPGDEPF